MHLKCCEDLAWLEERKEKSLLFKILAYCIHQRLEKQATSTLTPLPASQWNIILLSEPLVAVEKEEVVNWKKNVGLSVRKRKKNGRRGNTKLACFIFIICFYDNSYNVKISWVIWIYKWKKEMILADGARKTLFFFLFNFFAVMTLSHTHDTVSHMRFFVFSYFF